MAEPNPSYEEPSGYAGALIRDARHAFPQFYRGATPLDARLLDSLVLAHAALVVVLNAPRHLVAPELRMELERATNSNEQFFTDLRETVRRCPSFVRLSPSDQAEIVRGVFDIRMFPPV